MHESFLLIEELLRLLERRNLMYLVIIKLIFSLEFLVKINWKLFRSFL